MSTANEWPVFDMAVVRDRVLTVMRTEARPLSIGEVAMLLRLPTHRALQALEEARRDGQVQLAPDARWQLPDPFTPLPEDDGQQQLAT